MTTVEIREITPPRDVQDAMNRQLSAERNRRAVITESEGARQADDQRRRGREAGRDPARRGRAPGRDPRAEGFSQALERIFAAAHGIDEKTMALQYLEALKALGASPSTKYVIPIEFTRLAERIGEYVEVGHPRRSRPRRRRRAGPRQPAATRPAGEIEPGGATA